FWRGPGQRCLRDETIRDDSAADEMFLDDPLENRRIAVPVPGAFGIHDGNRSALTDAQAVCLGSENAALLGEAKLLQPALQEIPRGEPTVLLTTLRVRLIAAQKDVPPRDADPDALRNRSLRLVSHQPPASS